VKRSEWQSQRDKVAGEAERLKQREPPSLQQLVLDHGTDDKITPEAWAKFDADMAAWKAKIRFGEFPPKRI
jgi:predicted NAD-dependent protein-ADP-ribosyltransferase YbiA (DUF1768 family)